MKFDGKTALVTGAAAGIGRACAINFAKNGAKVVLVDVNEELLNQTVEEAKKYTDNVISYVCDVTDEHKVNTIVEDAQSKFDTIDILVNNAAVWRHEGPFEEIGTDVWRTYLDVNIMGVVHFTKAALPKMIENNYGRIINVSSVTGVYGKATMVHYSATKGAVIAMTKGLAKEVVDKGVLVNCVSPGSVSPAENRDMDYTEPTDLSFMGRTGSDNENADLISFLASDEASYISGQNIQIDGCRKAL